MSELDDFDKRILALVQNSNQIPQRKIADEVGLSAPAVQRRLQRLQSERYIRSNVAVLDPPRLGYPITAVVNVSVESEQLDKMDAIKRQFARHPNVQQCYYVTGEVDFVLIVLARSMVEYESVTRELFFQNKNIRRFTTHVAMDRIKIGLTIPLD